MCRALFLAMGLSCFMLGVEAMAIEKAVLNVETAVVNQGDYRFGQTASGVRREFVPPEWAPWSLVSTGAVVVLYSFSIPRRVKE